MFNLPSFLVIGAQKSGTTALFMYMRTHSRLFLPLQKEIGFFSNDELFKKGFEWYLDTYFEKVSNDKIIGEVSPQYMFYNCVPERIKAYLPEVRLIAILRNPIDRAYSHYRMALRRSKEKKIFSEAIRAKVARGIVPDSLVDPDTEYYLFSLYHRIIKNFLNHFPSEKILVIFQEDLANNPEKLVGCIFKFLGVEEFTPPNLEKKYHVSGFQRFPIIDKWLREQSAIRKMLKPWLPFKARQSIKFWLAQANIKKKPDSGPSVKDRIYLRDHFSSDVERLMKDMNIQPPWIDFM